MHLVLVSQYFWPEEFIINELVIELVKQNHSVYVLTGKPNYPSGTIYPGYEKKKCIKEPYIDGIDIFRVPLRPRGKKRGINLFLNYVSFVWNGIRYFSGATKGRPVDVILVFGLSPITAVLPAILLKWKTKAHLAVWVQDLWPQSLKATGYIKNPFILYLVNLVVRFIYKCSETLLVQSKAFIPPISKLANKDKIVYYPNSFPIKPKSTFSGTSIPKDLLDILDNDTCFIFAGNIGSAQAMDTLLDAAKKLNNLKRFKLLLVGNGSQFAHVEQRIKNESLTQVILTGRYPMEAMPVFFARAAALIVSLTKEEIFAYTIPSKIQAYLSAGRPIIASLNGEGAQVIQASGAGLTCPAEDAVNLAQCIQKVYDMSEEQRNTMGQSGYDYFLNHFEMSRQASKLIEILNTRLQQDV